MVTTYSYSEVGDLAHGPTNTTHDESAGKLSTSELARAALRAALSTEINKASTL